MIKAMNCDMQNFKQKTEEKRIFCFGSGKYFKIFLEHNPDIPVCGVIDNYRQGKNVETENGEYLLYSLQEFCRQYKEDCIAIVTVRAFEEVVDQLDAVDELDGLPCFFPCIFETYYPFGDEQRTIMKAQIEMLASRPRPDRQKASGEKIAGNQYQIWEYFDRSNIGGSKARTDIGRILEEKGYVMKKVHCILRESADSVEQRNIGEWMKVFREMPSNSTVVMQHPTPLESKLPEHVLREAKEEKHIRFIVMVHEVESLRKTYYSADRQKEYESMLLLGDVFIVHNNVMRQFFIEQGIAADRVISLDIFDYLDSGANAEKKLERSVTIAANLDLVKSPYLLQLKEVEDLKFHLYGPNFTEKIVEGNENICYHGSLPAEVIPGKLDRGFGLIWDGDSLETCSSGTGEYLKYNNPHKLSLYLSAGLPVIIWSQAAQAQFVLKNEVGFCVDSIYEISGRLSGMTEAQYMDYVRQAELLSRKLKDGSYFKSALQKAEEILCQIYA